MAIGFGYDVHRLVLGRRLVLAGVEFTSEVGLLGYSDADVAVHALMDALLGAAGLGDIGQHFPPGDSRFAEADSLALLRQVADMLRCRGWQIGNVDLTIVAEQPRINHHVPVMRHRLGEAMALDPTLVSVKATTNEGLGFIGRGEGIAAFAVAEIRPAKPSTSLASPPEGSARRD
ncbi:MAG TPA: 2-C-methyl-D-erythritol 2,4-cyclodiphosphate synthase [Chloroflexota bacterium]|nr:2-C-methyl-D-erythritol 2,4-cyclodiphosphate synthase [Chloroflexota bacterium]